MDAGPPTRRAFLAAMGGAGLTTLAGCSGTGSSADSGTATPPAETSETDGSQSGGKTTGTSGSMPPTAEHRLPLPMNPSELRAEAVSGGPGKDGIPSIDQPEFVDAAEADSFLKPDDVVFGVVRNGEVKAYPQSILVWHEITNDVIGDTPVSVTYCPLTGTVLGFDRGSTTFGVSGRLINNNLVMYDRATETWWPQMLAASIPGPWNTDPGTHFLQEFRLVWTRWKHWKAQHPDTLVLSTDTGHARNYTRDPYGSYTPRGGYYSPKKEPLFPALSSDDRFPPKTVVMGARAPEGAVAFRKDSIREQKLMTGELGKTPVLAAYDPRFDTAYVYRNPDDASFSFQAGRVVGPDGTNHAPDSLPLERIHTYDSMWFAWIGYYPESNVYA